MVDAGCSWGRIPGTQIPVNQSPDPSHTHPPS